VVIHYEEALYQVYGPLPLPLREHGTVSPWKDILRSTHLDPGVCASTPALRDLRKRYYYSAVSAYKQIHLHLLSPRARENRSQERVMTSRPTDAPQTVVKRGYKTSRGSQSQRALSA